MKLSIGLFVDDGSDVTATFSDNDTVNWGSLTLGKVKKEYNQIIIHSQKVFFSSGGILIKRNLKVLDLLTENGKILLEIYTQNQLTNYISKNYELIDNSSDFSVFQKKKPLSPLPLLTKSRRKISYKKVDYQFQTKDTLLPNQEKLSITLEEFIQEIGSDTFLNKLLKSHQSYISEKKEIYMRKILSLQAQIDLVEKEKKHIFNGVRTQDVFPDHYSNQTFIIRLKQIYRKLTEKEKELSLENIRSNLLDAIHNPNYGLASIIGRDDLKNSIVSQLYSFANNHKLFLHTFHNTVLSGPSGVGKTKTAQVIGYVYSNSNLLLTSEMKIVTRCDLVAQYVGQTAPRTKGILTSCLEGILFIDEAYQLYNSSENDFGHEAITEIVNFLDKYIGSIIVVMAGYQKDMKKLLLSNEGLIRRFPERYILSNYTPNELTDILISTIESHSNLELDQEVLNFLYTFICQYFSIFTHQAGDMLNLSSSIVKNIYSSYKKEWNSQNYIPILLEGINEYLSLKDIQIYIDKQ